MKTIKLTEEQKQLIKKPNAYIGGSFSDGIGWDMYIHNEGYYTSSDLDGPTPSGNGGWQRRDELNEIENHPGFILISEIAIDIADNLESDVYRELDCNDCSGSGTFYINYDAENRIFTAGLDVNIRLSEENYFMKTFNEWANTQPVSEWTRLPTVKKLSDPNFIEKYKNEGDDGVFELQYNGCGDSGQIDEPTDLPQEIEYLGYEIIEIYFNGWENNEGADGTIVIDFNQRTISIYHLQYREGDKSVELEKYQLV